MPRKQRNKKKFGKHKLRKKHSHRDRKKKKLKDRKKLAKSIQNEPNDISQSDATRMHLSATKLWTIRDTDDFHVPIDHSASSISECKSNVFWSVFPYKYRSNGKCHSFYLEFELASIFWLKGSFYIEPKLLAKVEEGKLEEDDFDELLGSLSNMTLSDIIYNYKMYLQIMMKSSDKRYESFLNVITFLESAQFGDVIHINHLPGSNGTYIIGFGDMEHNVMVKYYMTKEKDNIDITKYLKLIPVTNLFKKGEYRNYDRFNCIPIEFCDAPIHYFSEIPMNSYGAFCELRFMDPNRINLNCYKQNVMLKNLNNEILDIVNGIKKIEIPIFFYDGWDKIEIDIQTNTDFPRDYFVICDDLEFGNEFCWFKRDNSCKNGWDFDGLGIDSWVQRYDDAVRVKRLFFQMQFKNICGFLGEKVIEVISMYI